MTLDRQIYKIIKLSDLEKVNHMLFDEDEMVGCVSVWEYLGCGSETSEDGTIKPYYLLANRIYHKSEYDKQQEDDEVPNNTIQLPPNNKQ